MRQNDEGCDFQRVCGFGAPRADLLQNFQVAARRLGIVGQRVNGRSLFAKIARRFGFLPMPHIRREAMRWLSSKTPPPMRDTGPDFRRLRDGSIDPKWAGNFVLAARRLGVTSGSRGDAATLLSEIEKRFGFRPAKYAKYHALLWLNLQPPCVDRGK